MIAENSGVDEGAIAAEERARMVLGTYPRRMDEVLAPFENNHSFQDLVLEDWQELPLADPAWLDYQRDQDSQALARKQALFFRAVFLPSLGGALNRHGDGDPEAFNNFADQCQRRLTRCLADKRISADTLVQTLVVTKRG
jgi:hypothetical protein